MVVEVLVPCREAPTIVDHDVRRAEMAIRNGRVVEYPRQQLRRLEPFRADVVRHEIGNSVIVQVHEVRPIALDRFPDLRVQVVPVRVVPGDAIPVRIPIRFGFDSR